VVALASGLCVCVCVCARARARTRIYAAAAAAGNPNSACRLVAPCLLPIIFEKGIIWVSSPPLKFLFKLPG
jgi:hypothetical protein